MIQNAIKRLEYLIDTVPRLISEINEGEFSKKENPEKWSKKEILGHLIDSAANNHQRFVRAQFEQSPLIIYDQNNWNLFSFHQSISGKNILTFWLNYNSHLLEIIKRIPEEKLNNTVRVGENLLTLEFLISDYIAHMEYHLRQIVEF